MAMRCIPKLVSPFECFGTPPSTQLSSKKTFGWFVALSIDGNPNSVNHIGFDLGSHSVSCLSGFLCVFSHQYFRFFHAYSGSMGFF